MNTDTSEKIVRIITEKKQIRAHDLVKLLEISSVAIHKQLKKLIDKGAIEKRGKPPVVYYVLPRQTPIGMLLADAPITAPKKHIAGFTVLDPDAQRILDEYYLYISPRGEMIEGASGFIRWATSINEHSTIHKRANEYLKNRVDSNRHFTPQGWINATQSKVHTTFAHSSLDQLLYADFYSLPQFGKTKLGNMMLYAKQSQNKSLADKVIERVRPTIHRIIDFYEIDCVAFIPPSVVRSFQFMKEFAEKLQLPIKHFKLNKSYSDIVVPQKTLSRIEERIQNAEETIFVNTSKVTGVSKNILLIDDAVGSAATLDVVSNKIKEQNLVTGNIIGFAITGSMKGFEVIREV